MVLGHGLDVFSKGIVEWFEDVAEVELGLQGTNFECRDQAPKVH